MRCLYIYITAEGVISLCNLAKWTRVYIIASDTADEGTLGDAVHTAITSSTNITVTTYTKDGVEPGASQDALTTILTKVKQEARSKTFLNIMLNSVTS